MSPLTFITGILLATLMDIASGIIITKCLSYALDFRASLMDYGVGIFFSSFPDFDALIPLTKNFLHKLLPITKKQTNKKMAHITEKLASTGEVDSSHRSNWTHYPLVYLIPCSLLVIFSPFHSIQSFLCFFVHFVHDSWQSQDKKGLCCGIKWLAPLGENYYRVISKKYQGGKRQVLVTLKPQEAEAFFNYTVDEWLENMFFSREHGIRWTGENIAGLLAFTVAITIILLGQ